MRVAPKSSKGFPALFHMTKTKTLILLAILFFFLIAGYFHETASYIRLDIPSPISYLPNGDWDKATYSTQHFTDEYGRVLIVRKEGRAYGSFDDYTFDTLENVAQYFRDNLSTRGWKPSNSSSFYNTCIYGLPEKAYSDELYYEEYIKVEDNSEYPNEKVCVAIVQEERFEREDHNTYKAVLISSKYSPITAFLESFRRW